MKVRIYFNNNQRVEISVLRYCLFMTDILKHNLVPPHKMKLVRPLSRLQWSI